VKSLEQFAMEWLRYERRCVIVLNERTPRFWQGRPDCIGVTRDRHVVEVECKRTMSDFEANGNKRHLRNLTVFSDTFPRQYYFMVPYKLAARVKLLLPAWAGLMHAPNAMQAQQAWVVVRAPVNERAKRLSLRECVESVALMTNQILAQQRRIQELKDAMARNIQ